MQYFETAKLAAGIDLGKKLLGGRKKAAVQQERSAFFLVHLGSPWNAALTFKKKY